DAKPADMLLKMLSAFMWRVFSPSKKILSGAAAFTMLLTNACRYVANAAPCHLYGPAAFTKEAVRVVCASVCGTSAGTSSGVVFCAIWNSGQSSSCCHWRGTAFPGHPFL